MTNVEIATVFDQVADLLEFQNVNPFRVRAYRNAARVVRDLAEPVAAIIDDPDRKLTDIEGIGKDLADKITTLVKTQAASVVDRAAGGDSAKCPRAVTHSRAGTEEGRHAVPRTGNRQSRSGPRGVRRASRE